MVEYVRVIGGTSERKRQKRRSNQTTTASVNGTQDGFHSDFGKKFLEKFGWEKGKGLGVASEGQLEPLQLHKRSENLGVRLVPCTFITLLLVDWSRVSQSR